MKQNEKIQLLKVLAEKVKKLRVEKGVTQSEAYADTGIHFGRIEQGKRDITYTTLIALTVYFDVDVSELI